ncbi:MAG: hypothetical protein JZU47_12805 [Prolixibacteraceae bacterium]|nr:hypothetical protein [Prolixibacteraceae bacterium]
MASQGNGWLEGENPKNWPGMAVLKQDFPGNVLVEFEAQTILPSSHDINVMWNGEWLASTDQRGTAYVAGLQGWWTGKVGIEKSNDYKFMCGTALFHFEPGKIYKIQAGSISFSPTESYCSKLWILIRLTIKNVARSVSRHIVVKYVSGTSLYCKYIGNLST